MLIALFWTNPTSAKTCEQSLRTTLTLTLLRCILTGSSLVGWVGLCTETLLKLKPLKLLRQQEASWTWSRLKKISSRQSDVLTSMVTIGLILKLKTRQTRTLYLYLTSNTICLVTTLSKNLKMKLFSSSWMSPLSTSWGPPNNLVMSFSPSMWRTETSLEHDSWSSLQPRVARTSKQA